MDGLAGLALQLKHEHDEEDRVHHGAALGLADQRSRLAGMSRSCCRGDPLGEGHEGRRTGSVEDAGEVGLERAVPVDLGQPMEDGPAYVSAPWIAGFFGTSLAVPSTART